MRDSARMLPDTIKPSGDDLDRTVAAGVRHDRRSAGDDAK